VALEVGGPALQTLRQLEKSIEERAWSIATNVKRKAEGVRSKGRMHRAKSRGHRVILNRTV